MEIIHKHENDSDVEILEPEILKDHYRNQQLRLIAALSNSSYQIPKQWEEFQIFVLKVMKFPLSIDLVKAVWVQLCAADEKLSNTDNNICTIEISDGEEDGKQIQNVEEYDVGQLNNTIKIANGVIESTKKVKKDNGEQLMLNNGSIEISDGEEDAKQIQNVEEYDVGQLNNTIKIANGVIESTKRVKKYNGEQLMLNNGSIEVSDEDEESKERLKPNIEEQFVEASSSVKTNDTDVPKLATDVLKLDRSFCIQNTRKRKPKERRHSMPISLEEKEAEQLREQLLLDKIIELELPQVIKGFIQNNNIKTNIKRRKKSCSKKEVVKRILSDIEIVNEKSEEAS